jgi:nucleotide-binding universal stress UspA family protein
MSPNKVEVWKQHLVVGVDGSPSSSAALHWAKINAPVLGFRIELITTWERAYAATDLAGTGMPMTLESEGFDPEKAASEILTSSTQKIFDHHRPIDLVTKVVEGNPSRILLEASEHAAMLVVGCRGHGIFADIVLGSVSATCVAHAKCPVLVVHEEPKLAEKIVVGVDGSSSSISALQWAGEHSKQLNLPIEVITTWSQNFAYSGMVAYASGAIDTSHALAQEAEATLEQETALRKAFANIPIPSNLTTKVIEGNPSQVLLKASEGAALLILGCRGNALFADLVIGSVSNNCAEHAKSPVLIVH